MSRDRSDDGALADDTAWRAALDELEGLVLSEPGTLACRRFDELVMLIEEYEARRDGYLLLPRATRHRDAMAG